MDKSLHAAVGLVLILSATPALAHESAPDESPPDPSSGQPVTLGQLSTWASVHAPSVRTATQDVLAGDAEVEGASPILRENPSLRASGGARIEGPLKTASAGVGIEQPLEVAGQRGLRIRAAERERDVLLARVDQARWSLRAELHRAFHLALLAEQRADAAERLERFATTLFEVAERTVAAGQEAPISLLVAKTEVAEAHRRRIHAVQARDEALLYLVELTGWPSDKTLVLAPAALEVVRPRPTAELVALALEHHGELRTGAAEMEAAAAQVDLEERKAWPDPTVGVDFETAREGDNQVSLLLATLAFPLPFWDQNRGGRAKARARLSRATLQRELLADRLRVRIARARRAVNGAADRIDVYGRDIAPAFEQNLSLLERALQAGEIDIYRVAQMRERVLQAQQEAIEAHADYLEAAADLESLVGTDAWFTPER